MAKWRQTVEEVITKLWESEVGLAQRKTVGQVCSRLGSERGDLPPVASGVRRAADGSGEAPRATGSRTDSAAVGPPYTCGASSSGVSDSGDGSPSGSSVAGPGFDASGAGSLSSSVRSRTVCGGRENLMGSVGSGGS